MMMMEEEEEKNTCTNSVVHSNELRSFENSYIPENPRTPKPLTLSKNRLRGAKNRSNTSPVAKKNFRKNDFLFLFLHMYLSVFQTKQKNLHICKKKKKIAHMQSFSKKKSFFRKKNFATGLVFERFLAPRSWFFEKVNGLGVLGFSVSLKLINNVKFLCDSNAFKRCFHLSWNLFMRICSVLENRYRFFQQIYDARGRLDFSALQKCTTALRLIAYGASTDSFDEYLKMSERTARECLYRFSKDRKPSLSDVLKLFAAHEERHDFPGMLGGIDCTY
ncbi:hypothetical protein LXL04_028416 [Taraxacum kok-saghyz]